MFYVLLIIQIRVSSSNCARIYSLSIAKRISHILNNRLAYQGQAATHPHSSQTWVVSLELDGEYVLNGVFFYSLLLDKAERQERLIVSNDSTQRDRLQEALAERNKSMEGVGQEAYAHACDFCFVTFEDDAGRPGKHLRFRSTAFISDQLLLVKIQAAVCDGDTIGCRTCNVHNCTILLENQCARFCPTHDYMNSLCAVTGCGSQNVGGKQTCINAEHQALEEAYFSKGKALFQLKGRLRKARAANGTGDSIPNMTADVSDMVDNVEEDDSDDALVEIDLGGCDGKPDGGNWKLKAYFARRCTHNEQLIMRPCGVILSRATFYGAEAISSVHVS